MRDRAEMLPVPCFYHVLSNEISSACKGARGFKSVYAFYKGGIWENEEEGYEKYGL